jgi:hypothetical protein
MRLKRKLLQPGVLLTPKDMDILVAIDQYNHRMGSMDQADQSRKVR